MRNIFRFLFVCVLFLSLAYSAKAETQIHKDISVDTTWTKAGSPYVLTKTINIEKRATLTIEPGVSVIMPGGYAEMFTLKGRIEAVGTEEEKIEFDGGGDSSFINAQNSDSLAYAIFEYCDFHDGKALWKNGFGYFSLKNSTITNLSERSYIYYPSADVYIEHNEFHDFAGFAIGLGDGIKVYIRYNNFASKHQNIPAFDDYYIQNWAAYGESEVVAEYNTFILKEGIALELAKGIDPVKLNAINNYWGTTDLEAIADMVYDQNDDNGIAGVIEFNPILAIPDSSTPGLDIPATPIVNTVVSPTTVETQIISGSKEAGTALWINSEEVIAASTSTAWEYELNLTIGENTFNIALRNEAGFLSEEVVVNIVREEVSEETEIPLTGSEGETIPEKPAPTNTTVADEKALVTQVDKNLSKNLSGRILLQVEKNGEAWYVYPEDTKKYYLGRPADAFSVMRELGLGATHEFITSYDFFPTHVLGKILIDVGDNGKAYYINPVDKKAYYLGRPVDAFNVMRELGLGISNENLRKIEVEEI